MSKLSTTHGLYTVAALAPTKVLLVKSLWREGKLQEVVRGGGWQPPRGVAGSTRHVWTASATDLMKMLDIYSGCFATVVPSECPNCQEFDSI